MRRRIRAITAAARRSQEQDAEFVGKQTDSQTKTAEEIFDPICRLCRKPGERICWAEPYSADHMKAKGMYIECRCACHGIDERFR